MQLISQLVPIKEMAVDQAEDAPRVAKVESEVQRRHLTRLTVQDPAQASDEGDGGSLFDYVDSAAEQSPSDGDVEPSVPKFSDIWAAGGSLRRILFVLT
ncbi:hypothetical protein BJ322DRAFT_1104941 [Thelephora terrestris]|uniref:Uncharacterized protein n=1 Tax=Thelephora terrestris TaxID=56493 RepID=A0A9P6LAY6_9AGAM|nr:hypothetical protein BJ322DRAFT_1104941 [Thelephora terrestris]